MVFECEDVGEVVEGDIGGADDVDGRFAKGVDIHLAAADEPDEFFSDLGGALWIHASACRFEGRIFEGLGRFDFEGGITGWAVYWRKDWRSIAWALIQDN